MTNEEAMAIALSTNPLLRGSNGKIDGEYVECLIKALEKQIPKKMQTIEWDGDMLDKHCGICEYNLKGNERYWNYCPCCGHAIDWRDSECVDYLAVYGESPCDEMDEAIEVIAWREIEPFKDSDTND